MNISKKIENVNLINIRTLSGIKTRDNLKIKPNKLIRSPNLSKASQKDMEILFNQYNLKTVIDLRNSKEMEESPDFIYPGINYIQNPILTLKHMGMTHEKQTDLIQGKRDFVNRVRNNNDDGTYHMSNLYMNFVRDDFCIQQFSKFLHLCLENNDGAILYHCSVGKDRAGIATYLLLNLLNVDKKNIFEDYLSTNSYIKKSNQKEAEILAQNQVDPENFKRVFFNLYEVREQYLNSFEDEIIQKYVSFDNFIKIGLKFNLNEIDRLKEIYLD